VRGRIIKEYPIRDRDDMIREEEEFEEYPDKNTGRMVRQRKHAPGTLNYADEPNDRWRESQIMEGSAAETDRAKRRGALRWARPSTICIKCSKKGTTIPPTFGLKRTYKRINWTNNKTDGENGGRIGFCTLSVDESQAVI
jgi:hypothetical protein